MGIYLLLTLTIFVLYYHTYSEVNAISQTVIKNISSDVVLLNDSYLEESRQLGENEVGQKVYVDQDSSVTELGSGCFSAGNDSCNSEGVITRNNFVTTINDNIENEGVSDSNTGVSTEMVTAKVDNSTSQSFDAYGETSDNDVTDLIKGSATVSVTNNVRAAAGTTTNFTKVTSAIDVTTETPTHFKYSPVSYYCDCDMFKNECDINCCCDQDCTVKDKSLFVGCLPVRSDRIKSADDYSDRFCYSTQFIYTSDKTVARNIERNRNGLFCIAVDNLPVGILYENISPIKSVDEFDRKLKSSKRGIFGWMRARSCIGDKVDHPVVDVPFPLNNITQYRYGDYIWTFKNYSDSYLRPLFVLSPRHSSKPFPASVLSFTERQCYFGRPILYLKDDSYSCLRMVPKSKHNCEVTFKYIDGNLYYDKNLRILTAPHTILNETSISDYCTEDSCVDVALSICKDSNFLLCNDDVAVSPPMFYESIGRCSNVVKNVQYVFHLKGVENITKIEIGIHLVNLSSSNMKSEFFRQHFEIKFHRSMYNKSQGVITPAKVPLIKSGTPGYTVGKPIITGKKVNLLSGFERENHSSQNIFLNSDKKYWLGLPGVESSSGGECDPYARRNIMFLENFKSECMLRVPLFCDSIRDRTLEILLGGYYSINVTDRRGINIYVSSYGDPDPADPVSWVPMLIRKITTSPKIRGLFHGREQCNQVFTDVDVKILYSYFGAIDRPQAKIVGALMSLRFDDKAVVRIGDDFKILRMTGAVKFIDISKPDDAVIKFADPPVYEIKLPQDFFYPFLSRSLQVTPSFQNVIASIFLSSYLHIFGIIELVKITVGKYLKLLVNVFKQQQQLQLQLS